MMTGARATVVKDPTALVVIVWAVVVAPPPVLLRAVSLVGRLIPLITVVVRHVASRVQIVVA
jgi:hypothetical protein